jgi:hypothetical protein
MVTVTSYQPSQLFVKKIQKELSRSLLMIRLIQVVYMV